MELSLKRLSYEDNKKNLRLVELLAETCNSSTYLTRAQKLFNAIASYLGSNAKASKREDNCFIEIEYKNIKLELRALNLMGKRVLHTRARFARSIQMHELRDFTLSPHVDGNEFPMFIMGLIRGRNLSTLKADVYHMNYLEPITEQEAYALMGFNYAD